MKQKKQISHILNMKKNGEAIPMLTAYDATMARMLDEAGIPIILVGDSLGNVFSGHNNTLPVTVEQMLYHTQAVSRVTEHAFVIADMPFLSYQVSCEDARLNAGVLVKEGGAQAVKMEINSPALIENAKAVIDIGVPVMGHIGFTPQAVYALGGYKVQGRGEQREALIELARALEDAGCFALLLEMVPQDLAAQITEILTIPTVGIGAGKDCDGQVLVTQDMLGYNSGFTPKFVKTYASVNDISQKAIQDYIKDVQTQQFPADEHGYK